MEEQTAKSDVRNGLQNDIPRLQSMLANLNLKHKHPKTADVNLHPDTVCKCVSYNSLGPEGSVTNEEDKKDNTVRSDGDEEQATRSPDTERRKEAVEEITDVFPKWKRKSLLSSDLPIETQVAEVTRPPSESESLEDKKNKETEEHVAGAALFTNSPSQETSAHTSYLSVSLDKVDSEQVGLKHEPLDEACGGLSKPVSIDMSSVLTHQFPANVTGKTTRSASDPVTPKPKGERPLSAPSISNLREYEKYENAVTAKSFSKATKILGQEYSDVSIGNVTKTQKKGVKNKMKHFTQKLMVRLKDKSYCEHTGSNSTQDNVEEGQKLNSSMVEAEAQDIPPPLPPKKGKYVFLDRRFTLKDFRLNLEPINLMEEIFTSNEWLRYLPIKESPAEKDTSDQSNDVLLPEKAIQLDVPLLTPKQEQSEDIKTPEEDIKTPKQEQSEEIKAPEQDIKISKEDQSENIKTPKQEQSEEIKAPEQDIKISKEDQSENIKTPNREQSEDIQTKNDRKTPKQEQPEDIKTPEEDIKTPKLDRKTPKQNQSGDINDNQNNVSDPQEYNAAKVNCDLDVKQVERDPNIFAIPKALLTKNPVQPRANMSNKSDDIYDSVDMYIIPKNDIPFRKRKVSDAPLDFSAVKSSQLLDNSALKGRIRLSKKRHHRPPKNHKKVKTEMSSAVFYNIPPVILKGASPPRHIPFSTSPPLHSPSRP